MSELIHSIDSQLVVNAEDAKAIGIKQPGVIKGISYKDCSGNLRHKYETLVVFNPETVKSIIENVTSEVEDSVEPDTAPEDIPTSATITLNGKDIVVPVKNKKEPLAKKAPAKKTTTTKK